MAHVPVDLVEVRAFGATVGAVAPDPQSGAYVFEYAPAWRRTGIELSPLHMSSGQAFHSFPGLNRNTFQGLPPLLADCLPDRFGNALVDAWMARQGIPAGTITTLDRLAYTGTRGMGALTFHPPTGPVGEEPTAVALADLVESARRALRGEFGADDDTSDALADLIGVGTSAGGARPKAVIAYNPDTGQIRTGQFDAPTGFGHWLCKFDGVDATNAGHTPALGDGLPFGRIEYAYHLMAGEAGIDMTECHLLTEHDRAHFLTRRFDRTDGGDRLHLLTLCGMAHLDFNQPRVHDYAQYLDVIHILRLGPTALVQAFRRIVFNVAAVNCDDHTKNLSFLMDPDGTWSLSPAYDMTYAYNPSGDWANAHQMSVQGKFSAITQSDLANLADQFAVPSPGDIIERVSDAVADWAGFADEAGVPGDLTDEIARAHRTLGIAR